MNELPSVALTRRFLSECRCHGSERFAVRLVVLGQRAGVSGLPASADWAEWDGDQMQAAVDYLEQMRIR